MTHPRRALRVCCIGDLHGRVPAETPKCDLLLIAGDVGPDLEEEAEAFLLEEFEPWLKRQPARRIIGIAGNHDFTARSKPHLMHSLSWSYLEHETADVDGTVTLGSPWTPKLGNWAFMAEEEELASLWAQIPHDVEILLVHGPPQGLVDLTVGGVHAGSRSLSTRLGQLTQLKLLCCGHIHEAHGRDTLPCGATIVNASLVEHYRPVNRPIVVELT